MSTASRQRVTVPAVTMLSIVSLAVGAAAQERSRVELRTIPVADKLHVLFGGGGNVAALVGEDGVLLVDSGMVELSDKFASAIKELTKQPVRMVVNTHWHFDHVGGNEVLATSKATIIAQENVRQRMSAGQYITVVDRQVPPAPAAALPMLTFAESLTLHVAGEEVRVLHVGPAHTDGDSFVHFIKANVLHVGDTCFNGMYPFMDVNAGGSLDGMIAAIDRALALADERTKIIPGHGSLLDKAGLKTYRDMLATVRDRVRTLVKEGKSREEVIAAKPTREFDEQWGRSWLDPNTWTGLVYDGMARK